MHHLTRGAACAVAVDDASAAADVCGVAARGTAVGDGGSAVTQACRDGAIWACVTRLALASSSGGVAGTMIGAVCCGVAGEGIAQAGR